MDRLAYQYDPHFAVSVSQVDPLPHQMDAVYSHLLTQPRIRFLIADDPGAGKTIMAGLTIKELKFRGLVMRILIITPANLTDQWRRELHDKFGETFTVVNRGTVSASYGRNVWEDSLRCITSVDFVARQDDILNDPDNFALLLQLLDQDLYANGQILAEASAQGENRIMIRRLKEDMKKFDGAPCFPARHVQSRCRSKRRTAAGMPRRCLAVRSPATSKSRAEPVWAVWR